jgi:hypothetical protein
MITGIKALYTRARNWLTVEVCGPCYEALLPKLTRIEFILFIDQSTTTRLWFGLTGLFFSFFFFLSPTVHSDLSEYRLMLALAPHWLWALGFAVNGLALMYGAYTNAYSKLQLFLEGVLGVVVWCGSAYAVVTTQGSLGAHAVGGAIAFWVYVRYPTHWEGQNVVE